MQFTHRQIFDLMMNRLGQMNSTNLRNSCIAEMNATLRQLDAESFLPWFLQSETAGSLPAGDDRFDLPADFLREDEDGALELRVGTDKLFPEKRILEQLERYEWQGRPVAYALRGNRIIFSHPADQTYTYRIEYLRKGGLAQIEDNDSQPENLWLVNSLDYSMYRALMVVSGFHAREKGADNKFAANAKMTRDELWRQHEARQHTNADYELER